MSRKLKHYTTTCRFGILATWKLEWLWNSRWKSRALKRQACKRFVYAGISKPRVLPRNLAGILRGRTTRIIALWWEPQAAHARTADSQWGNVKKKSTRLSRPEQITSLSSVSRAPLSHSFAKERGPTGTIGSVDGDRFLANAHRKMHRNSAEIGSFRCKVGWTHYSLLIPIPADFSHNRVDPWRVFSLNEKSCYYAVKFISQIRFPPAVVSAKLDRPYN